MSLAKPKILYHASQNRKLEVLEPRAEKIRDEFEGPVVFASLDKANVTKFLVPSDDSWTKKMCFGDVHVHIISDRKRYEKADKGGTIYHLSPSLFELDKTKGGGKNEWTTKVPIKPIGRENFDSGLQAQLENGVQVFFVDKKTLKLINQSDDHGNEIIRKLKSENEEKNINIKIIPKVF